MQKDARHCDGERLLLLPIRERWTLGKPVAGMVCRSRVCMLEAGVQALYIPVKINIKPGRELSDV